MKLEQAIENILKLEEHTRKNIPNVHYGFLFHKFWTKYYCPTSDWIEPMTEETVVKQAYQETELLYVRTYRNHERKMKWQGIKKIK